MAQEFQKESEVIDWKRNQELLENVKNIRESFQTAGYARGNVFRVTNARAANKHIAGWMQGRIKKGDILLDLGDETTGPEDSDTMTLLRPHFNSFILLESCNTLRGKGWHGLSQSKFSYSLITGVPIGEKVHTLDSQIVDNLEQNGYFSFVNTNRPVVDMTPDFLKGGPLQN